MNRLPVTPEVAVAVEQVLARYCHLVDHGPHHELADCFTEWASFEVAGTRLDGRSKISLHFAQRAETGGATRHVVTNVLIEQRGDRDAGVTSTLTVYAVGSVVPVLIADVADRVVKEGKVWRIAERRLVPVATA